MSQIARGVLSGCGDCKPQHLSALAAAIRQSKRLPVSFALREMTFKVRILAGLVTSIDVYLFAMQMLMQLRGQTLFDFKRLTSNTMFVERFAVLIDDDVAGDTGEVVVPLFLDYTGHSYKVRTRLLPANLTHSYHVCVGLQQVRVSATATAGDILHKLAQGGLGDADWALHECIRTSGTMGRCNSQVW